MTSSTSKEHYFFEFSRSRSALLRWVLVLCAFLLGGVAGFLSVMLAQGLLKLGGDDSAEKHGISTQQASRLGGVIVFGFMSFSLLWHELSNSLNLMTPEVIGVVVLCAGFFSLGLFEDLKGLLKANTRFILMTAMMGAFLMLRPEFMLRNTGLALLDDWILAFTPVAFVFTLFGMVFLINAFNTADGANGLISGVSIFAIIGLVQLGLGSTGSLLAIVAVGCGIFWLFNVTVGRIFMGDGGAYFLGALLGLVLVVVCNTQQESVWYLLCLIFYPHADLLFSMVRRRAGGKSLFGADNGHLHNLLYRRLSTIKGIRHQANTATGLLIALVFAGLPLVIKNIFTDINWLWMYCLMWFLYSMAWGFFSDRKTRDVEFKMAKSKLI